MFEIVVYIASAIVVLVSASIAISYFSKDKFNKNIEKIDTSAYRLFNFSNPKDVYILFKDKTHEQIMSFIKETLNHKGYILLADLYDFMGAEYKAPIDYTHGWLDEYSFCVEDNSEFFVKVFISPPIHIVFADEVVKYGALNG